MKTPTMNELIAKGYTTQQISQLIKIEELKVDIQELLEPEASSLIISKDITYFRQLRTILERSGYSGYQKQLIFKAFTRNIDYVVYLDELAKDQAIFTLECIIDCVDNNWDYDLTPMRNKSYSLKMLSNIYNDICDGIDVKTYLNSTLSTPKKELLRYALQKGYNVEEDLIKYSFISSKDEIEDIITMRTASYDYKSLLQKLKSTSNTLYVLQKKAEGHDVSDVVRKDESLQVVDALIALKDSGYDVKIFSTITLHSVKQMNLLKSLHDKKFNIKKVKNNSVDTLLLILEALKSNEEGKYGYIDIDKILAASDELDNQVHFACYKYNQTHYIDLLKNLAFFFKDSIIRLLNYNFENPENQVDIIYLLYKANEKKMENEQIVDFLTKIIVDYGCTDMDLIKKMKESNMNASKLKIIYQTYCDFYDVDFMFDNRLSESDLNAIKRCYNLGLTIKKEQEFNEEALSSKYNYSSDGYNPIKCSFSNGKYFIIDNCDDYHIMEW